MPIKLFQGRIEALETQVNAWLERESITDFDIQLVYSGEQGRDHLIIIVKYVTPSLQSTPGGEPSNAELNYTHTNNTTSFVTPTDVNWHD